jgi:sugar lactone lactonase YvrE
VFWTEFTSGEIWSVGIAGDGSSPQMVAPGGPAKHPYRIAADDSVVCWTNEGTVHTTDMGAVPDGSVECSFLDGNPAAVVASGQNTPRAIALDSSGVYWATFAAGGAVLKAPRGMNGGIGTPEVVAEGLSFPNGIAVDDTHIYWTTWGDGGVHRIAKTSGGTVENLASGQRRPGEIAIGGTHIFWVNEGSALGSGQGSELIGDGAIMRRLK